MHKLPGRKYSVLIHFRLSLNKCTPVDNNVCRQLPGEPIYVGIGLFSQSSLPWPLIIWSAYFRKLLCTCFLFLASRDTVDTQWMQLRRRCLVQYLQSMLVVTFSEVLLARSLQKIFRNKIVVSKPTTINYRRSIKLSDSDFFWSFISKSSDQMFNLMLLVRKV